MHGQFRELREGFRKLCGRQFMLDARSFQDCQFPRSGL